MNAATKLKAALVGLIFLALASCASAPAIDISAADGLPEKILKIDAWLDQITEKEHFNATVLIGLNGRILLEKNNGLAERSSQRKITPESSYYIASVSKHITATVLGMLVDRQRLSLSDDISAYLPQLPYRGITIADLLHHTSGLPNETDFFKASFTDQELQKFLAGAGISGRMMDNADVINLLANARLAPHFTAGQAWEYNNINYYLLASIVEQLTTETFPVFVDTNICQPLGLTHTQVYFERMAPGLLPERVYGYSSAGLADLTAKNGAYGAGNVYTSAEDLFAINEALFAGKLVKPETLRSMLEPVRLTKGQMPSAGKGSVGYGMGFFINQTPRGILAWHDGSYRGFRAYVGRKIDSGIVMIVLDNSIGDDDNRHYLELNQAFEQL